MVNRHFLRKKVLQSLYAYFVSGEDNMQGIEKFMFDNIAKLYQLEIYLLSTILEIRDLELVRIEAAQHKFYPTEQEKNPDMRFVNNVFLGRLNNHQELKDAIAKYHINWVNNKELLQSIWKHFSQSQSYKEFMKKENHLYEDARKIVIQLFKNYIIKSEDLYDVLCEKGFAWECDYDYVCQITLQFLKNWQLDEDAQKELPYPFDRSDNTKEENDQDFMKFLYENTILHHKEYEPYIDKRIQNWDRERLAFLDVLIIKMAMTEFIYNPYIPLRVTLNEYIELAKEFSTEKSRLFVNGVLDRLITDLRIDNKIHKEDNEDAMYFEHTEQTKDYYVNRAEEQQ